MTEPHVQRGTLWFWLPISLGVGLLIVALGAGLEPAGASMLRAPLSSPVAGAVGFGMLLVWAAYAYALSAGRAAGSREMGVAILNLGLPVGVVLLWQVELNALAFFVALGWTISLGGMGMRLFRREALAGLMVLPLFGASLSALLMALTLWMLPEARGF